MEAAFQSGDVGETALLCWESLARFPAQSSVARIYVKKLLRDPEVAQVTLDAFKANAKELREAGESAELAQLAALGLLRFPLQRYLTLSLVDAGQKLGRKEWLRPAILALGEPDDDDVVLLNAVAGLEQEAGNYERAYKIFKRLRRLDESNETILQNYSAALVGLKRYDEAISTLEDYLPQSEEPRQYILRLVPLYRLTGEEADVEARVDELDSRIFAACETPAKARVHAELRLFRQDIPGMGRGLERLLEHRWNPGDAFELAEVEIAQGKMEAGLERYGVRFEAFPKLAWFSSERDIYQGQQLEDEVLFIWGEQGIGDEVMFAMFLQLLETKARNVLIAVDKRLGQALAKEYPQWTFFDRHELPEQLPHFDLVCPMGKLMEMWLPSLLHSEHQFKQPIFRPDPARHKVISELLSNKTRPRIAITWRGGSSVNGKIRSMELQELLQGLPENAEVDIISVQYDGEHEQEVVAHGDPRVALSGLNNRWDLEGVFALLSCCDAVLTVDNAVAHFACALGVPTAVLIPAAQIQFRWKNEGMQKLLFPCAQLFIQPKPGDWSTPVSRAWQFVLDRIAMQSEAGVD